MCKEYYFYRKTIRPDDYEIYLYGSGIVGYTKERPEQSLYFKGTEKGLQDYMKNQFVPRRVESKSTLVSY